jgi:hypothetical protein
MSLLEDTPYVSRVWQTQNPLNIVTCGNCECGMALGEMTGKPATGW